MVSLCLIVRTASAELDAPKWEIHDICAGSSASCTRVENQSRDAVLDRWNATPERNRAACLLEAKNAAKRSYQRLLECLSDLALKDFQSSPAEDPR